MNWEEKDSLRLESRSGRKEVPSVWVVTDPMNRCGEHVTVIGWQDFSCEMFVPGIWHGIVNGYGYGYKGHGYNRQTAAMAGCVIFGIEIQNTEESFTDQLVRNGLRVIHAL